MVQKQLPGRVATPDDRTQVVAPIVGGLQELVFENPGIFLDRPGFIAGGAPDTVLGGIVQAISRLNCRNWAAADKSGFSARVNSTNAELCNPYLDSIGEKPDPGFLGFPFEGGQCAGVLYDLSWDEEQYFGDCSSIVGSPSLIGRPGPIGQIVYTGSSPCPDALGTAAFTSDANGPFILGGAGGGVRILNFTVTRNDGLPDSCGNPAPEYRPPATVTPTSPIPPDITIDLPDVGPIDVTVDLGPDGDLVLDFPDIDVEVEIQVGGGGSGGGGGPTDPPAPPPPPDPGDPGTPQETDGEGTAGDDADEGEELVGVLVEVLTAPQGANKFENNPAQPFRGIGYVRMGFPGRLGTDISGGTVISPQFFHAQQRGLTSWEVRANTGYELRVTPYYREIPE